MQSGHRLPDAPQCAGSAYNPIIRRFQLPERRIALGKFHQNGRMLLILPQHSRNRDTRDCIQTFGRILMTFQESPGLVRSIFPKVRQQNTYSAIRGCDLQDAPSVLHPAVDAHISEPCTLGREPRFVCNPGPQCNRTLLHLIAHAGQIKPDRAVRQFLIHAGHKAFYCV